jgi:hypothetical protein
MEELAADNPGSMLAMISPVFGEIFTSSARSSFASCVAIQSVTLFSAASTGVGCRSQSRACRREEMEELAADNPGSDHVCHWNAGNDFARLRRNLHLQCAFFVCILCGNPVGHTRSRVLVDEKKWKSWLLTIQGVIMFANGNLVDGLLLLLNQRNRQTEWKVFLQVAHRLFGVCMSVEITLVDEKKWKSWLLTIQGVIMFANGNLVDGLLAFRRDKCSGCCS